MNLYFCFYAPDAIGARYNCLRCQAYEQAMLYYSRT